MVARDEAGDFRLLGVYGSFPSDLDTELKGLGRKLGKFKKLDSATYEREREFVYQFLMELYGFPIASERRTSGALFARRLSRLKEQYLIKVLGASDRTITSLSGFEQKRYPLVEKIALIPLSPSLAEANPQSPGRRLLRGPRPAGGDPEGDLPAAQVQPVQCPGGPGHVHRAPGDHPPATTAAGKSTSIS